MTDQEIDELAKIIWNYHQLHHDIKPSSAILGLGSMDTRVAERSAQLYLDGYAPLLVFSGGLGKLSQDSFDRPEAEIFAGIATAMGVPEEKIIVENKSSNTGENIIFTHDVLANASIAAPNLIVVHKPYMERRAYATFAKQWPDKNTAITVTSPRVSYADYPNDAYPRDLLISIMVGDLQRIREYPKLGLQIEQEIPNEVWSAYEQLVHEGFNQHLIEPPHI